MSNRSASGKRLRASALDPATTNPPSAKRRRGVPASNVIGAERIASPDAQSEMSVIGSGLHAVPGPMARQHLLSECSSICSDAILAEHPFLSKGTVEFTLPTTSRSVSPMPCGTFTERAPAMPCHDHGVLSFDVGMTDAASARPVKCPSPAPSPLPCSPSVPPHDAISLVGMERSLAVLNETSHQARMRTTARERSDKGTADAYSRRVRDYVTWWDSYQRECCEHDRTWTVVPAFPVTAVKAALFIDYETTREKVSLPASRTSLLVCTHRLWCRGSQGPWRPSPAQTLANPSSSKSSMPSRTGESTTTISTSTCLKLRSDYETTTESARWNLLPSTMSQSAQTVHKH
jgi:hypothetical protein